MNPYREPRLQKSFRVTSKMKRFVKLKHFINNEYVGPTFGVLTVPVWYPFVLCFGIVQMIITCDIEDIENAS